MARYVTRVRSPWSADRAFAYMADLTNFPEWDPGTKSARQVAGEGAGPDAAFELTVAAAPSDIDLTYRTVEWDPPRGVYLVAEGRWLTSKDRISVAPEEAGCVVTYDAELTLRGVLGIADLALRPVFQRIGDKAAAGLREALEGTEA